MRKIYSIVLMAAALLIGTNMQAESVASWDALRSALEDGGEVTLSQDIDVAYDATTFKSILIGAKNSAGTALAVDGTAPAAATLDLAGHNITITANSFADINPFVLTKGSLTVTGTGTIEVKGKLNKSTNVFFVFGADEANKVDPKGTNPFSKLVIDANVSVKTNNGSVIAIDALTVKHKALTQTKDFANKGYATSGMAYGVFVDVKGSLISELPQAGANEKKCYGIKVNGLVKKPADEANYKYAPYVYVEPSAVIIADNSADMDGATAIYASGYGQWLIKGNCSGATGVYISSGVVTIDDATVKSAAEHNAPGSGTHANGSGSAIVINSRSNYQGEVVVTVSGDSKIQSTSGYAFEDVINTKDTNSKVDSISIKGGSFEGGTLGAVSITTATATQGEVKVNGGNVSGGSSNIGDQTLAQFLNTQGGTHATLVEDENGKTVMVISEGSAPVGNAAVAGSTGAVNWKHLDDATTAMAETLTADLTLAELEINQAYAQTLTIGDPENADESKRAVTLTIGRVVLGKNAQIIVNPGSKLIVTGEQGIVAPVTSNIVLKHNSTTGKYATFLFNPAVTSNKHPNATVEFTTNSWSVDDANFQWEWFGIPTYTTATSITSTVSEGNKYYATVEVFENDAWTNLGYIGGTYDNNPAVLAKLNKPFAAYNLLAYRTQSEVAPKITIAGELVGNVNAPLNANMRWNTFANSYTAEIDATAFVNYIKSHSSNISAAIYVAIRNNEGTLTWNGKDDETVAEENIKLKPMQAFLLNNTKNVDETAIDYASAVYASSTAAGAPARRFAPANNNTVKVRVNVENENGTWDDVEVRENVNTKAYEKYLNSDINIYVVDGEKNDIIAVENIENTFVGFSTVKGGKFTLSFTRAEGRELMLVDHETGAQVAITEGNTYEFTAAANSANDYRFEIVEPAKLPTAIENAEAVKSAKGIYTITGQYVGEMNVWNTLPAGIYVVNGEKLVK